MTANEPERRHARAGSFGSECHRPRYRNLENLDNLYGQADASPKRQPEIICRWFSADGLQSVATTEVTRYS
jgi:hypothetical protein